MRTTVEPYVRAYLSSAPLFMAIVRGVECAIIRSAELELEPVLDLGCGDGLFASLSCKIRPTLGMDPSPPALAEAQARKAHRGLVCASATEMSLRSNSIGAIVCNSVMEHIPDLDEALRECRRVLKPHGRLIITSPSERFGEMLLGTRLLSSLGFRQAAAGYARWFNAHSFHYHTLSMEEWRRRLDEAGFHIREGWHYLDAASHATFDLMHYLSGWRWIRRKITGSWSGERALGNRLWAPWFVSLTEKSWPAETGPYLYIDAERKD